MKKTLLFIALYLGVLHFSYSQCNEFQKWIPEWKQQKYNAASTAQNANYLNEEEKKFYYFLNLMRLNPSLFAETFLDKCTDWNSANSLGYVVMFGKDIQQLSKELKKMRPLPAVAPMREECILASCYNKDESCPNFQVSGTSSSMYYENTGMRLLMSILKSQSNNQAKQILLSEKTTFFGISILPTLKKGQTSARLTKFDRKVLEIKENESGDETISNYTEALNQSNTVMDILPHEKAFLEAVPAWKNPKYNIAHTAQNIDYLTENEKLVYYYLNLARLNPPLFAETFLVKYKKWNSHENLNLSDYYTGSLYKTMKNMQPVGVLYPQKDLFESAKCHAISSGKKGYVGHARLANSNCVAKFSGECCSYGQFDALNIVMQLLIDSGVPSLGHRKICLDGRYKTLGVSVQPHKTYRFNSVLDFGK
ncbi:CAP domain-containing protein [Bernardetia sp.]|uniref:CAP domain-containing protein n=1 Tax=Bernardetia sp. TaxID=1937974 RepID=UPI0025C3EE9A|nr:CAP domain-containing protein [Bernardetia sp.]